MIAGTRKPLPHNEQSLSDIFKTERARVEGGGVRALTEYQKDPIGFLVNVLGFKREQLEWDVNAGYDSHEWDGDRNPLAKLANALVEGEHGKDVGVEAATGTQKSYTAAGLILWFLGSFRDAVVFTFAPKEDQLRNFIWMEIRKMWPRFKVHFPDAEMLDLKIRIIPGDNRWGATGYAVGVGAEEEIATKAQGMHATHMLLVYEETPGIHTAVMEAGENTCTAPHNRRLALGNPNHQRDTLHKFCTDPGVVHVRISALDHPNVVTGNHNVVPGAVSRQSIERREQRYTKDSPKYLSRVRGISPEDSAESLIMQSWIERAVQRWRDAMEFRNARPDNELPGKVAKGVDVARSENGDRAAIATFRGAVCEKVETRRCRDTAQFGRDLFREMKAQNVEPRHVGVDPIGVGAGTVDTLNGMLRVVYSDVRGGLAYQVQELNGAASWDGTLKAADGSSAEYIGTSADFGNLRAAMYWQLAIDFQHGNIAIPPDDGLIEELRALKSEERRGRIYIIEKDDIRDELGRSPDKSDALAYGNWVRPRMKEAERRKRASEDRHPGFRREGNRVRYADEVGERDPEYHIPQYSMPQWGDD